MSNKDFATEFANIGNQIRNATVRVRAELASQAAKERAEAEKSLRSHLERLVGNVEIAVREGEGYALLLKLEGEHALGKGHENEWRETNDQLHGWYIPNGEKVLSPGALLACRLLTQQNIKVVISGPKNHPMLMVEVPTSMETQ